LNIIIGIKKRIVINQFIGSAGHPVVQRKVEKHKKGVEVKTAL